MLIVETRSIAGRPVEDQVWSAGALSIPQDAERTAAMRVSRRSYLILLTAILGCLTWFDARFEGVDAELSPVRVAQMSQVAPVENTWCSFL